MAEFIPVSLIKNNLTECPICTEQFEEEVRIPRRMPCCVQSICQPCLETYSKGQTKVSCPMCRREHLLPGGVSSLAKEPLILRILDQLKIQKGVKISCTDCPDKNDAVARCEDCCISLCEECLRAHRRVPTLKNHSVKTFEELKGLPVEDVKHVHQCEEHRHPLEFYCTTCDKVICVSCTVLEHEKGDSHRVISIPKAHKEISEEIDAFLTKLDEKDQYLTELVRKLELEGDMFKESGAKAREGVTSTFDSLIEVLELKKANLLSQLDHKMESYLKQLGDTNADAKTILTLVRSSSEYTRNMRRKADQIEDIQLTSSSMPSLRAVQGKQVKDLKSFDIEKEVDASKELIDVVNLYLQEDSYVGKTCKDTPPLPLGPLASAPPPFGQPTNMGPPFGRLTNMSPPFGQPTSRQPPFGQPTSRPPPFGQPTSTPPPFGLPTQMQPPETTAPVAVPSVEQQREVLQELLKTPLKEGDSWYLVDIKWSKSLRSFLDLDSKSNDVSRNTPGLIDNRSLLTENGELKQHLVNDKDYQLYPEEAWKKLEIWYGVVDNQIPIQRKVIKQGMFIKRCKVEVYTLELKLCHHAIRIRNFSRTDTIGHLEKVMRREFGIQEEKHVRLWNKYLGSTYKLLDNSQKTLDDFDIYQSQVYVIEEMNKDGSWSK